MALLLSLALWLTWAPAPHAQAPAPATTSAPLQVLFIGNSFTFFNTLPDVVAGIAKSLPKGPAIEPTMFATGGMTLQWFWAAGKAAAEIDSRKWDYVILQEQSALGAGTEVGNGSLSPPGIFHQSVRNFVPRIRMDGATPLLLMTWARRSRPTDQALLTDAYDSIGHELGVTVSPAGIAWQEAHRLWPDLDMHVADGSHPNPTGTYLTACVLYATITGRDPRGAAAKIDGHPYSRRLQALDLEQQVTLVALPPALAKRLQELAWKVVTQRGIGKG
ncbi:MAG: SGNH/GDSL hydrolase family protein [Vicinamibacterales bacterium]